MSSQALVQHLSKLLDQVIGQIDFGMELAKHEQGLLLFTTEFFRSTKKKEGSLSCEHRRARKQIGSVGILPSFGKKPNQLFVHGPIRVGVATGYQFPVQLSDSMTACFPPLAEKGEVWIKIGLSRARLLLGK